MKKSILLFLSIFIGINVYAQPPQKMSYQSVLRDIDQNLLANQNVGLRISILQGSPDGMAVFSETHTTTTNANGLISLVIGEGNNETGSIGNIDWGLGSYYLKIETDPNGGSDYSISGASELLSVPYALYAGSGGSGDTDWTEDMDNDLVYTDYNVAVLSSGTELFRINTATMPGLGRVVTGSSTGIGVHAQTATGFGIRGEAAQGVGVHGLARDFGVAIRGEGETGAGVEGLSEGGPGIFGKSDMSHSIQGEGIADGKAGVYGNGKLGYGVIGQTEDNTKAGVLGDGGTIAYGVEGRTQAVAKAGVLGDGGTIANGIEGRTQAAAKVGVLGDGGENSMGVQGISKKVDGVKGESEENNGVTGVTLDDAMEENIMPGFIGKGTSVNSGVLGRAAKSPGVIGRSTKYSGMIGYSVEANGMLAGTDTDKRSHAAVLGGAALTHGIYGNSTMAMGVLGRTKGTETDITNPGSIEALDEDNSSGVMGIGTGTFGVVGIGGNAGVYGYSSSSNGVTGASTAGGSDMAGLLGLAQGASGVIGWSQTGSGVRGKSDSGVAGEFEGEVHIENGGKTAKLKIDMMEKDNNAPCLVWSGDKYVRMKDCWNVEEEDGTEYFVSSKGIRLTSGDNTVFQVNPDGTSLHKGLETFESGIDIPIGNGYSISIIPGDGIAIANRATEDYVWHANTLGDSFAKNSFSTVFLSANSVAAGALDATVVSAKVKEFKIDHPLDPENKYLVHSSIESDERVNIYSGNVETDSGGFAVVSLPDWFEALNEDFRYQLTVIGSFAQAIIKEEIQNGEFLIQTNQPKIKVSWQVTGVRHDQWALDNPTVTELPKMKPE